MKFMIVCIYIEREKKNNRLMRGERGGGQGDGGLRRKHQ